MSNRRALNVISVGTPCPADWEQMAGDGASRFCSHCQKFVHNLSAMPADEAERLVCGNAGNLCVRFARDPQTGGVLTLGYARKPRTSRARGLATITAIGGAIVSVAAWAGVKALRKQPPAPPVFVMGDSVLPTAPPPGVTTP